MEDRDCEELVLVLCGYYRLLTESHLEVTQEKSRWTEEQGEFPSFSTVLPMILFLFVIGKMK